MNNLVNKVQLIGNLGAAPELITLENGKKLAKFSIATNETYRTKGGEKVTDTQWHNMVAWGKSAELIESLLSKGIRVAIEGKLVNRSWDDKNGNKRYTTEIVVGDFMILTPKASE